MNQLELIEKELRNNDNTLFHIYLYNEGDWWRAYEWSAYLCTHINMTDGLILKPTHKNLKGSDNGIEFLGIFSHYKSFNIRKNLFLNMKLTKDIGIFNELFTKFIPYNKLPIV